MTVKSNDAESMHLVGVGGRRRAGAGNNMDDHGEGEEHFSLLVRPPSVVGLLGDGKT
jgi:hypothetical protein